MEKAVKKRIRDSKGRFISGGTNAPGPGRPQKDAELKAQCKDLTPKVLERFKGILEMGRDSDALKVGEVILAYGHGKPETASKVDFTGSLELDTSHEIDFSILTFEQKKELYTLLEALSPEASA